MLRGLLGGRGSVIYRFLYIKKEVSSPLPCLTFFFFYRSINTNDENQKIFSFKSKKSTHTHKKSKKSSNTHSFVDKLIVLSLMIDDNQKCIKHKKIIQRINALDIKKLKRKKFSRIYFSFSFFWCLV